MAEPTNKSSGFGVCSICLIVNREIAPSGVNQCLFSRVGKQQNSEHN